MFEDFPEIVTEDKYQTLAKQLPYEDLAAVNLGIGEAGEVILVSTEQDRAFAWLEPDEAITLAVRLIDAANLIRRAS